MPAVQLSQRIAEKVRAHARACGAEGLRTGRLLDDATLAGFLGPEAWRLARFLDPHRCFEAPHASWREGAWLIAGYLDEGFWRSANPHGVRRISICHCTLEMYRETLARHSLSIRTAREARASPEPLVAQSHQVVDLPSGNGGNGMRREAAATWGNLLGLERCSPPIPRFEFLHMSTLRLASKS